MSSRGHHIEDYQLEVLPVRPVIPVTWQGHWVSDIEDSEGGCGGGWLDALDILLASFMTSNWRPPSAVETSPLNFFPHKCFTKNTLINRISTNFFVYLKLCNMNLENKDWHSFDIQNNIKNKPLIHLLNKFSGTKVFTIHFLCINVFREGGRQLLIGIK